MNETRVIHAFLKGETIFGLTDDGHLVAIDPLLNKWVYRASNAVLDTEKAVMVKKESFTAPYIAGQVVFKPAPPSLLGLILGWIKSLFKRA
jgi:hypothetical protein